MNSLHSIPKEKPTNPFNLTQDQMNTIRAYKYNFPEGGVGIWLQDGKVVQMGWDNRDGHESGSPREFIPWRNSAWLDIYTTRHQYINYEEFQSSWIVGIFDMRHGTQIGIT